MISVFKGLGFITQDVNGHKNEFIWHGDYHLYIYIYIYMQDSLHLEICANKEKDLWQQQML